jgi:transposase
MHITSVGIDLGKMTFHLVALGEHGKVVTRKKFSRKQLLAYTANMPASLVGMECCSGAHFIGAALRDQGHDVRLIPAQFVKPFLKSNKNDFLDAEAIAEAVARQNMRFVPIKTDDQLDLQAMHRVRDRLVHRRTALINQIRGFLLERGIAFAKGPAHLRNHMAALLEDAEQNITPRMRSLLDGVWQEWKHLDRDHRDHGGDRKDLQRRCGLQAPAADPWRRTAGLDRDCRRDRQRRRFPQGTRLRGVARTRPATALHRRQGQALRH